MNHDPELRKMGEALERVNEKLAAVTAERDDARQSWRGAISLLEERTAERDELRRSVDGFSHMLTAANDDNDRLTAERDELLKACKKVTVNLMAAISLLENSTKTAAPSDKMFDIMLNDYRRAVEIGRAAVGYTKGADDGHTS